MRGTADFDATGRYRWRLGRIWGEGPRVVFVMLNPNQADAERDDPSIRRCIGFARAWGHGSLDVVNLFAWRCRDPRDLRGAIDPVGPDNDAWIARVVAGADVVVAWGNHGALQGRDRAVLDLLRAPWCLGTTRLGHPRHPLYLPSGTPRVRLG